MKNIRLLIETYRWPVRRLIILAVICALILMDNAIMAQETKDKAEKLSFSMNVSSIVSNGVRTVKAAISRKENKKTILVDDLQSPLNLYLTEVKEHDPATGTGWMSRVYINNEGEGLFIFPAWFKALADSIHEYTFIVKAENDPKYEDAEEQISVSDARINLGYSGEDSVKTLTAQISGWKEKEFVPLPEAELKLCIKRTFNFLPFGELGATTSETGEISGEMPADIPGNINGTITLAARLEDHETYGTVEVTKDVPWAILPKKNPERGRTLWSGGDNAPLLLVISSLAIITVIWSTILYLVYLLYKIKRLGKI